MGFSFVENVDERVPSHAESGYRPLLISPHAFLEDEVNYKIQPQI